jgi:hypothetical protein
MGLSNKEDYSEYVGTVSNTINVLALLSGFMFASLTVLLNGLPDLSSALSQSVLLVAAFFLDFFLFLLQAFVSGLMPYVRMPRLTRRIAVFNLLTVLSILFGMGSVTILMFFAYKLVYLALAQLAMWIGFGIAAWVYVYVPMGHKRMEKGKAEAY